MKLIAAIDNERNIGNNNSLLFHIPDDMKFFREQTINKVVIMGRKTLDSFPGGIPLKNRTNIVLSHEVRNVAGAEFFNDVDSILERIKGYNTDDVFVIGGESTYKLMLPYCDTAILTQIDTVAKQADKKFPNLDSKDWYLFSETPVHESNGYKFTWCEYKRK